MFFFRRRFLLVFILLLCTFFPAAAQSAEGAILSAPDTTNFPTIRTHLEAFDASGAFIHDLQPEDITIIEDNRSIPVKDLQLEESGAQFVVAINQGPSFAIRDSNGISRYDPLQTALTTWAEAHTAGLDDLSFVTNGGIETLHGSTGAEWLQSFQSFEADFRAAVPSLDVLIRAIEIASEPLERPDMGRAILLLTPPPEFPSTGTLQSMLSLAKNENIRVHVWMVSSPESFTSAGAEQLLDLATQTGGSFFAFSGTENIPEIDPYLAPLRFVYQLSYETGIRNSDPHKLYARINHNGTQIESEPVDFELEVLPPNPIFISPPLEITRANQASLSDTLSEIAEYVPESQKLEILVEFPDGRPRSLDRTILYVDGMVVDERNTPPFDTLTWDLKPFQTSGSHNLQVEVVDSLGLSGSSIEHTIQITIKQTPQRVLSTLVENAPIVAGAAAALVGAVLLLVLVVRGHIRPRTFGRRRKKKNKKELSPPTPVGAASEAVSSKEASPRRRFSNWINPSSWSQRLPRPGRESQESRVIAYLEYLQNNHQGQTPEPIKVKIGEITFGKDPTKATAILNDNTIGDLHARLVVSSEGTCRIFDEGSTAGTWLNYKPLSAEGETIRHGDIIHIGRIGFCYKITDKSAIPKPIVIPLEPSP